MSQLGGWFKEKVGGLTDKVVFVVPSDEAGKYTKICSRYISSRQSTVKVRDREWPVSIKDWSQRVGNSFIQYKDWNYVKQYRIGDDSCFVKPNGTILSSKELGVNKAAEVAKAVVSGGQLNAGLILLVLAGVAGLMGGIMIGYLGLPAAMGQHFVSNAVVVPK